MRISDWSSDVCSSDLRVGSDIGVAVAVAADPVSKRKKALWPVFEELVPRRIEARHGRQEAFPHEGNGVFHLVGDEEPVGPERPRLPEQRDLAAEDRKSTRLNSSH